MFLLRTRRPGRYGKGIDRTLAPGDDEPSDDPGIALDGGLTGIEFDAWDVPADEQNGLDDDGSKPPERP